MGTPDNLLYEYAVVRYVPRVDRGEFINIGLVMMNKRNKWMKARIWIDADRIKALFPYTDIDCLKNQSRVFEMTDVPACDLPVEEKYRWLTAVKSACLQVSPSHPGIVPSFPSPEENNAISLMEDEFSRLFSSLVF